MFYIGEIVRAGNSSAKVQQYDPETGFIVLNNVEGSIEAGTTIIGEESNTSLTLTNFEIDNKYALDPYRIYDWESYVDKLIIMENDNSILTTDNQIHATEEVQGYNLEEAILLE
jgi:hypothetical protein